MRSLKRIALGCLLLLLVLNILIWISGTTYVYRAVWYNFADIHDYRIFDNRVVDAGIYLPLPEAATYNQHLLPATLRATLDKLETIAFVVVRRDSVVHEQYSDDHGPQNLSGSFSIAKSITSMLTGIALREGTLESLDVPVGDYLPAYATGEKADITFRHLLTMSSGLNWKESYIMPISHTTEAYYGRDLPALINRLQVKNTPGTQWRYKSGDTQLLGLALAEAVGYSLSEYASEKLWKPLGASREALWSIDRPEGYEKTYCCFNATARDFARLGLLYANHGIWRGDTLVDPDFVRRSLQPVLLPDSEEGDTVNYYGYSWWLLPEYAPDTVYYARGILGQYLIVLPDDDIVIVRLGLQRGTKRNQHREEVFTMIDGVRETFR